MSKSTIKDLKQEINDLKQQLEQLATKCKETNTQQDTLQENSKNYSKLEEKVGDLEKKLQILGENYTKTNTQLINLRQNVEESSSIKGYFDSVSNEIEKMKPEVQSIKEIKNQIFSVMALFFGIFTFISIDIGITRSLLSYFSVADDNIISIKYDVLLYYIIGALVFVQIIFFICIYYCLLVPFLNRANNECKTNKIQYLILVFTILLLVFICFLCREISSLSKRQDLIEQRTINHPKKIGTKVIN